MFYLLIEIILLLLLVSCANTPFETKAKLQNGKKIIIRYNYEPSRSSNCQKLKEIVREEKPKNEIVRYDEIHQGKLTNEAIAYITKNAIPANFVKITTNQVNPPKIIFTYYRCQLGEEFHIPSPEDPGWNAVYTTGTIIELLTHPASPQGYRTRATSTGIIK